MSLDAIRRKLQKLVSLGVYNDKDITSFGGHIGKFGGTVGYDRKLKKPFGSANVKGKIISKFGPQGE